MSHDHHEIKQPVGWMDKPDVVKRLFLIFYVICGALFLAEFVLLGTENAHPHPLEERMRFFVYPVYGFLSFWFLVLLARPMRTLLIRPEDYYEADGAEADGHGRAGGTGPAPSAGHGGGSHDAR